MLSYPAETTAHHIAEFLIRFHFETDPTQRETVVIEDWSGTMISSDAFAANTTLA